jgi:hypothetical protein
MTNQSIAHTYAKARKSAFIIGQAWLADSRKVVVMNLLIEISAQAFKEILKIIKGSFIVENPLKVILKNKKTNK